MLSQSRLANSHSFWLFHDLDENEIAVLRKFIDPEIDLAPLKGIHRLIDKLYHILQ
ncbi:MAG: hypothetical protein ACP6IT_01470 [Candidatus Thorarchaeota archaeon]